VDRTGREESLPVPIRAYQYLRVSPDGTHVALDIRDHDCDIWIWTFASQRLTRLTFDPAQDSFPVWTQDSRRVVFTSMRNGMPALYAQAADGTGSASLVAASPTIRIPASSSPDGTFLLVNEMTSQPSLLMFTVKTNSGSSAPTTPQPLIATPAGEANGEVSPDGRWLAYQSNDSGRDEIYVRPFPDTNGGRRPCSWDQGFSRQQGRSRASSKSHLTAAVPPNAERPRGACLASRMCANKVVAGRGHAAGLHVEIVRF
jgi:Tol biopolymer transport system component